MDTKKYYTAVDFNGPFLDRLLDHFRRQQKAGEGLDLHLQADNPEDKLSLHQVMVLPRSQLIGDLVTPGLPITLHIPEASLNSLNLLVQLLYGTPVEVSKDVLPQLCSICKALGLGDWLEETLLTAKDIQADVPVTQIMEPKDEFMRDETLKEADLENPPDPLDVSVISEARRSPRVQALQCELCDSTCYSLASLQRHYEKSHFGPASGKRVRRGRVIKTTPAKFSGESKNCGSTRVLSRKVSASKYLLYDVATDQECRVNLKDLKRQEGVVAEFMGKGKLSELVATAKVSKYGGLQLGQAIEMEPLSVDNHASNSNDLMKTTEDYSHLTKVAEEGANIDTPMSGGRKLKHRGRTQTAVRSSARHQHVAPPRAGTCPRKMLDKGLLLKKEKLMQSPLKRGRKQDEAETRGKSSTSSPLTIPRLRSRQSKDGSGGEGANEAAKEEYFFLLWNKFLANKVVPGAGRLRQHLPSVLKSFFSARAGQINQHALLPQALQHVSNLEEEGLLSQEASSKLMRMLQQTI